MTSSVQTYTAWHPLVTGCPPAWASEWGEDVYGVFAAFTINDVTQRLRWIPPGSFWMGSPEDEPGRHDDEGPRHRVTLTCGYWLFDTPCTQVLWQAVMNTNPSRFKSPDRPVDTVSWHDAQNFIRRLNAQLPGMNLTLPTEAQWERACRAGTDTALYTGPIEILGVYNAPNLDPVAWYGGNSGQDFELDKGADSTDWKEKQYPHTRAGTHHVALKAPNPWGLYDMLGNVWEWCADGLRDYRVGLIIDPVGPSDSDRVARGGSWFNLAKRCRAAFRSSNGVGVRRRDLSFRCTCLHR